MRPARSLLTRYPAFAAAMLLCALLVRVLVPAGFMPEASAGIVTLQLCSGTMPAAPVPMVDMHHGGAKHEAPAKAEQPCAFAGIVAPALGSADPVLLAAALAFVFLLTVRGGAPVLPARPARLRPPLRAPPLPA
jgi:hypothetical protein